MRVMKDERGRSRGFGFVNYANHEDAQKVVCAKFLFTLGLGVASSSSEII